jgi:hypothetical protein
MPSFAARDILAAPAAPMWQRAVTLSARVHGVESTELETCRPRRDFTGGQAEHHLCVACRMAVIAVVVGWRQGQSGESGCMPVAVGWKGADAWAPTGGDGLQ